MAYRRTPKIETRLAETRDRILQSAIQLIAANGYKATSMGAIAAEAGVSTGLLYRYFSSKSEIFNEVFQQISTREIAACWAAASTGTTSRDRLTRVLDTFSRRAFRERRLAWAMLIEPVDEHLDAERLRFRTPYRDIFSSLLREAVAAGEIPPLAVEVVASAIVGAVVESLTGPLSTVTERDEEDRVVETLTHFCLQAVGYRDDASRDE
ncbi:TetR/AcrR family transcriptional regulator [Aneurinibacillus aneurinilyticus]|jgi:AcrR family transcriptional regulator|uniref:TetR/AcrR family transcriptional regulator n=1 Tax=Aneurinibacillus aneurinilyticus TaxID=1391 RepID=A0A848D5F2_ANEAE|nr:TetR/AcrR family transcriptional regulator [Aneurinibacillus aneurinilyticus]MCI1693145.1 TetR/AcrR family transcriptional regulator [Aneurinibacillus aneurinilyticus]NMF00921.1 TetR/AcrR family transcriptional regulator [Aneurinibacillus aneurinilyticus]